MELVIHPDPRLKKKCTEVTEFDDDLVSLVIDMQKTMKRYNGAGLAGPQVGVMKRILVYVQEHGQESVMVNPVILEEDGKQEFKEGCLSFPGVYITVERPAKLKVQFQNTDGEVQEAEFEGFIAQCIHHEIDHLEGKLYDRFLSSLKRDVIVRKMKKVKKQRDQQKKQLEEFARQFGGQVRLR